MILLIYLLILFCCCLFFNSQHSFLHTFSRLVFFELINDIVEDAVPSFFPENNKSPNIKGSLKTNEKIQLIKIRRPVSELSCLCPCVLLWMKTALQICKYYIRKLQRDKSREQLTIQIEFSVCDREVIPMKCQHCGQLNKT